VPGISDEGCSTWPLTDDDLEPDENMPVDTVDTHAGGDRRNKEGIDLLLSGGGIRATLFHLGVIRYLHESVMLDQVRQVFSVSGGSILAGFLALNWTSFTEAEDFDLAASEVIKYTQSDVRGRIFRRWLASLIAVVSILCGLLSMALFYRSVSMLPLLIAALLLLGALLVWQWRRVALITLFEADLRRFLRRINKPKKGRTALSLKDLPRGDSKSGPRFTFLATDLTTGDPWSFTNEGVWMGSEQATLVKHDLYPVCSAVAASAAFPPLFSPVRFGREIDKNNLKMDHYLADGGVYGFLLLSRDAHRRHAFLLGRSSAA
jgi:predicted acylesterase/phospholipase RssA